jgi:hypothetical protein
MSGNGSEEPEAHSFQHLDHHLFEGQFSSLGRYVRPPGEATISVESTINSINCQILLTLGKSQPFRHNSYYENHYPIGCF